MSKLSWWKGFYAVVLLCAATAIALPAQTFTTLVNFLGNNGASPYYVSLVQGTDGDLYGVTGTGGAKGRGTVFKVTLTGMLTTLYSFCVQPNCTDGQGPYGGLVLGADENFYGTTTGGGTSAACNGGCGTLFKVSSRGALTTLHSFDGTDGASPTAVLVQGTDGAFYGTTSGGANGSCTNGCGTVFKISSKGTLATLHNFDSTDGGNPEAALLQATDGNFYGTTAYGGANDYGTVFRITPAGAITILHSFSEDSGDGGQPVAALVQATDETFYGTTESGGAYGYGTVFKITARGKLTTLHSFDVADGSLPSAGPVQATDGNLYGTTDFGGSNCLTGFGGGCGTAFKIIPGDTLTTLHNFDSADGDDVQGRLLQATNGMFYGTTAAGGEVEWGTIFSLDLGLGPFVKTLPTARKVGAKVAILGNNLRGTTSVTFNGLPATFEVASSTEIAATVPAGATSGTVKVVTPGGTLSSNVLFTVVP